MPYVAEYVRLELNVVHGVKSSHPDKLYLLVLKTSMQSAAKIESSNVDLVSMCKNASSQHTPRNERAVEKGRRNGILDLFLQTPARILANHA